jgi:2-polyprenyl-3-methyl-5-hydroxy-6-metoxy-1,4-benzoquinol methylase
MSFYSEFAEYYEKIFPFSPSVSSFIQEHLHNNASILDVGCGPGHYAGYLESEGYDVTALDLDQAMIAYAKDVYLGVNFYCMDMRHIRKLDKRYGLIYCIGNTAAHLTQSDFELFIKDVYLNLVPGGIWMLQIMNWDYVLKQQTVSFPAIVTEDNLRFERSYGDISPNQVTFSASLTKDNATVFSEQTILYPLKTNDILVIHRKQGLQVLAQFGDYSKNVFDPDILSANIFVFTKPSNSDA